ncbi:MAG: YhdH/YhfP family quinone oxidoreductase [Halieaceae bacterium]|jgi:alcohol dehydrogenase|nr:YhdH/YhfP family quinone oxidoreductase [Halieaceae bacterium]
MPTFTALRVSKQDKTFSMAVESQETADLPAGDLLIKVHYSSLNYKDALSASGNPGVTRNFPHTPGIDAAGVIESSDDPRFAAGDAVIVTGYDLGMNTPGGLGGYIRVPADWAVPLPEGLSLRESMIIGTAGLTAALCLLKLEMMELKPGGRVVVSGASGGVGSFAVALLAKLGYQAVASTGSPYAADWLKARGAAEIIDRSVLAKADPRPMAAGQWDGAIDTVGGDTLGNIIKELNYGASVAVVGLVGGTGIPVTVFPFILRDVNLLGVDSVEISHARRVETWGKLATNWKLDDLEGLASEIGLEDVPGYLEGLLKGTVRGRTLVNLNA